MHKIDYTKIAQGYKPTKKADLLGDLERLAEYLPDCEENWDIQSLLTGIAANFAKHVKKGFIDSAVSKDTTRLALTEIYNDADNDCLVSTDGSRLHIVDGALFDSNTYIHKKSKTIIDLPCRYPTYQAIMPNLANCHRHENWFVTYDKEFAYVELEEESDNMEALVIRLNKVFYLDAMLMGDCALYYKDKYSPVLFEGDKKKAVLMPNVNRSKRK